jgi:tRNA (cmo5U34)-methyltransferase
MERGTEALRRIVPGAQAMLDLGCGAGNWTVKLLSKLPDLTCTLLDLSPAMLERARSRVEILSKKPVTAIEGDFRSIILEAGFFDIVTAGATLHHLRDIEEWRALFTKVYTALRKGGVFLISDLVSHQNAALAGYARECWADYLLQAGGVEMRESILRLSDEEDTPRPLSWQIELLREAGFESVEIIHLNACFATFTAIK